MDRRLIALLIAALSMTFVPMPVWSQAWWGVGVGAGGVVPVITPGGSAPIASAEGSSRNSGAFSTLGSASYIGPSGLVLNPTGYVCPKHMIALGSFYGPQRFSPQTNLVGTGVVYGLDDRAQLGVSLISASGAANGTQRALFGKYQLLRESARAPISLSFGASFLNGDFPLRQSFFLAASRRVSPAASRHPIHLHAGVSRDEGKFGGDDDRVYGFAGASAQLCDRLLLTGEWRGRSIGQPHDGSALGFQYAVRSGWGVTLGIVSAGGGKHDLYLGTGHGFSLGRAAKFPAIRQTSESASLHPDGDLGETAAAQDESDSAQQPPHKRSEPREPAPFIGLSGLMLNPTGYVFPRGNVALGSFHLPQRLPPTTPGGRGLDLISTGTMFGLTNRVQAGISLLSASGAGSGTQWSASGKYQFVSEDHGSPVSVALSAAAFTGDFPIRRSFSLAASRRLNLHPQHRAHLHVGLGDDALHIAGSSQTRNFGFAGLDAELTRRLQLMVEWRGKSVAQTHPSSAAGVNYLFGGGWGLTAGAMKSGSSSGYDPYVAVGHGFIIGR